MASLRWTHLLPLLSLLLGLLLATAGSSAEPLGGPRQHSQARLLRQLKVRKGRNYEPAAAKRQYQSPLDSATMQDLESKRVQFEEKAHEVPVQQMLDYVEKLPGQPPVGFKQYAGYVTVDAAAGRALFYWFVEATSKPETKPLVLWLNGGPGCSSVAYGAAEELGPFHVNADGATLFRNNYSWNKVANVLFVESPVGVGYSYSNTSSDYLTNGDRRTATDSLSFLLNWFERFPQYKCREFFITGESYAGNYVPQLSQMVYHYNKGLAEPFMNFKGFMVGNAVMDSLRDDEGALDYWWTHALISDSTHKVLVPCFANFSARCDDAVNMAYNEQGNIDPYNIYVPVCLKNATTSKIKPRRKTGNRLRGYDPCVDNYVISYFNRPDVQHALHANVTGIPYPWTPCSDPVNLNWQDSDPSVIPIYEELMAADLKIWVYSGDVDSVVPVTSTKYSLGLMNLTVTVPWYPWYRDQQVGGYTEAYENLTFVTVRGAGHEVPEFQPARALTLITSYLTDIPLPSS